MANYVIRLTDAQEKALQFVAVDVQDWIENAVYERCRIAIDDIVSKEVERKLAAGEPILGSKEDIVMRADIVLAKDRAQDQVE